MNTISNVGINDALNQQNKTSVATGKLAEDFTQFLTLLTIQLQNQDPLSPMDTTEFTNQLVGFAGVEQQINSNQKLDNLVALSLNNAMGSALGYVGMDVSYLSSEMNFDGTTPVKIDYSLDRAAVNSKIRIFDEGGDLVFETDASKNAGRNSFTWDGSLTPNGGTAVAGTYTVKIDAFDSTDTKISTSTVVTGRVRGIESQDGIVNLLIGERAVPIGNVLNAIKPNTINPNA
jgi:flagellar basal-body rod modification protein FlgD